MIAGLWPFVAAVLVPILGVCLVLVLQGRLERAVIAARQVRCETGPSAVPDFTAEREALLARGLKPTASGEYERWLLDWVRAGGNPADLDPGDGVA